jgi:hypothetical protein
MKKMTFILLTIIFALSNNAWSQKPVVVNDKTKVQVYYFHGTQRCATCLAIEENARKTLQNYFPEQLKNGTIQFASVNIDEKENFKLAEKYEAGGSALWLTKISNGKETKKDMTNFAFSYGRSNPEKFFAGLKDEINNLLK